MFLIAGKILELEDIQTVAARLGLYIVTVVLGLVIHAGGCLPLTYFILTRKNPLTVFRTVFQAWITALATASRLVNSLKIYNNAICGVWWLQRSL
jgi:solute carrier family 1 (high affinity glutamate transporter) protein 2